MNKNIIIGALALVIIVGGVWMYNNNQNNIMLTSSGEVADDPYSNPTIIQTPEVKAPVQQQATVNTQVAAKPTGGNAMSDDGVSYAAIYKGEKGDKPTVTYFQLNRKMMVTIKWPDSSKGPYTLTQEPEAWGKGAIYSDNGVEWATQGDDATLKEGKVVTKYTTIQNLP